MSCRESCRQPMGKAHDVIHHEVGKRLSGLELPTQVAHIALEFLNV